MWGKCDEVGDWSIFARKNTVDYYPRMNAREYILSRTMGILVRSCKLKEQYRRLSVLGSL